MSGDAPRRGSRGGIQRHLHGQGSQRPLEVATFLRHVRPEDAFGLLVPRRLVQRLAARDHGYLGAEVRPGLAGLQGALAWQWPDDVLRPRPRGLSRSRSRRWISSRQSATLEPDEDVMLLARLQCKAE